MEAEKPSVYGAYEPILEGLNCALFVGLKNAKM